MSSFKLKGESLNIVDENISKLKELFPEMVTCDGEIDFDAFKEIFESSDEIITDSYEEHYKFTWWGKKESKAIAKETTTKTLRPVKKDSKNWDTTQNIYIEGDNLDALKILLKSYRNKIKMMYIDPPYNTGKDFVYKDNRTQSSKEYIESTDQLSEDGYLFENAKTDGKYHSNWLNMMYPRIYLARKLLTDDGVIFISIDDTEVENLRKICDEIFGEENRLDRGTLIWPNKGSTKGFNKIVKNHEYILAYSKNADLVKSYYGENNPEKMDLIDERLMIKRSPKNPVTTVKFPKGLQIEGVSDIEFNSSIGNGTNRLDIVEGKMVFENGELVDDVTLEGSFPYKNQMIEFFSKLGTGEKTYDYKGQEWKEVYFTKTGVPYFRKYRKFKIISSILEDIPNSGFSDLKALGLETLFDNPKPVDLIYTLITYFCDKNDLIMDFFSGSATTAQAVFKSNLMNEASRNFISIQLPELIEDSEETGFNNICEVGKERIRRAGDKIVEESGNDFLDVGFKIFKIDESNFIPWNPNLTAENVEQAILSTGNNLVDGRSELDLVYELLLKEINLGLNCPIDETTINGKKIYIIDNGYALICLENKLDASIADDLLKLKEDLMVEYSEVILKDEALDDNTSINIYETLNSNGMEFYTI